MLKLLGPAMLAGLLLVGFGSTAALAEKSSDGQPVVDVQISISRQTLTVTANGWPHGWWQISSAGQGYHTPRGKYRVQRLAKVYFSKKYDNSPMPNSVFFHGGYAIHGTYHVKSLGRPVSHGCVRLSPEHAAELYSLVQKYGPSHTRITVND